MVVLLPAPHVQIVLPLALAEGVHRAIGHVLNIAADPLKVQGIVPAAS